MATPFKVPIKDSIATQLLKIVFGIYLSVSIFVTGIHMITEYYHTKTTIFEELKVVHQTIEPGIATSVWDQYVEQLQSILQGIVKLPVVVGVKVEDENGKQIGVIGVIMNQKGETLSVDAKGNSTPSKEEVFWNQSPLIYTGEGENTTVGVVTIYSDSAVVFKRVRLGFLFLIINSIIKTVALWAIFLLVSRVLLSRPLRKLTRATEELNLDNPEEIKVDIELSGRHELKVLEEAFNNMAHKLWGTHNKLKEYNILTSNTAKAYSRFFPHKILTHLNKTSIIELEKGDHVQCEMTILFSDIRSFTTLSETMSPEDNFRFLNSYLEKMGPCIRNHHGFIDKFIGDAIMALFDQDVDDAVYAGIEMLIQLNRFNQLRKEVGFTPIEIGIGVHTGSTILGAIGEEERMETTVISDTVNTAARLEGMTKLYGTPLLISETVHNQLKSPNEIATRFIDRVQAKGRTGTLNIFEVYNGYPSKTFNKITRIHQDFQQGVSLYFEHNFTEAKKRFEKCLSIFQDDKASEMYLKRCDHNLKAGFKDDWDGITRLNTK